MGESPWSYSDATDYRGDGRGSTDSANRFRKTTNRESGRIARRMLRARYLVFKSMIFDQWVRSFVRRGNRDEDVGQQLLGRRISRIVDVDLVAGAFAATQVLLR